MGLARDLFEHVLLVARESAKERNKGKEPDELHVAYEVELMAVRTENDRLRQIIKSMRPGQ